MRSYASFFGLISSVALSACASDGSPPEQTNEMLGGSGSSNGGSGGSSGQSNAGGAGGGGGTASSEVPGDLNLAGASAGGSEPTPSSGGTSGAGGSSAPDAGEPPVASSICPPGPFADSPLPAGATAQPVCGGMTFTEGAVWFHDRGTLFFSDFANGGAGNGNFDGRIFTYTPGGTCEVFIQNAGTNGLAIAPDGNLLGCRHSDQTLTIFNLETLAPTVLVADNAGDAFNSPNDVAVRSDGNLYFTDPDYLRGNRMSEQPTRAYRRDPSGTLSVIDEGVNTNGITLSPDESRLYLSRLGGGQNNSILVFDVNGAGALGEPETFVANVGSDGMAIDCAGNLYITQGGVRIYTPDGDLIDTIAAPGAANVAFGGPERRTLYITAGTQLLAVELAIPGLPY